MPEEKESNKYTTISIPTPLANKIKERIKNTGFNSLSSYVVYVLREVISNVDDDEQETAFSKDDEEKVKERLRALGYLD